jgi:hypothetical protein
MNHNIHRYDVIRTERNMAIERAIHRHRFEPEPRRRRTRRRTDQ